LQKCQFDICYSRGAAIAFYNSIDSSQASLVDSRRRADIQRLRAKRFLDADQETHQISIFFSGPKPFGEAGVALYRNLVAGLKERLGTERVSASSTSSAGQVLLESPGRGANDVGV